MNGWELTSLVTAVRTGIALFQQRLWSILNMKGGFCKLFWLFFFSDPWDFGGVFLVLFNFQSIIIFSEGSC